MDLTELKKPTIIVPMEGEVEGMGQGSPDDKPVEVPNGTA